MRRKLHIVIQERDLRILRGFLEARVMTYKHATALFFSGRVHAARKRLQILKSAGFVAERPRKNFECSVLHLTKSALCLLRDRGILKEYPPLAISAHGERVCVSDITIRHELEVMDVKALLCAAIAKTDSASVIEFTTWPQLIQFECSLFGAPVTVKPDGFVQVRITNAGQESVRSFYLELDRSTEKQAVLVHRASCYLAHLKSGGFAARQGVRRADFRQKPFRVLFVLKSAERRNIIAEALLKNNPPILTHVWLTTFDDFTRDPLGPIWFRPVDYRDALFLTSHDVERRRGARGYRRNSVRDSLVEERTKKRNLLGD